MPQPRSERVSYSDVLVTNDRDLLDMNKHEHKSFAPGVGLVKLGEDGERPPRNLAGLHPHAEVTERTGHAMEASGLYHIYHQSDVKTVALRGAELALEPGTWTTVMGPSGSGKSTLVYILAGSSNRAGEWSTSTAKTSPGCHRPRVLGGAVGGSAWCSNGTISTRFSTSARTSNCRYASRVEVARESRPRRPAYRTDRARRTETAPGRPVVGW